MGEFSTQGNQQLIATDLVTAAMNMRGTDDHYFDPETKQVVSRKYVDINGWNITDGPPEYGVDMARYGDDSTVVTPRHSGWVEDQIVWNKTDLMTSADKILHIIDPLDPSVRVNIDDSGNGCVTADTKLLTPSGWVKSQDLKAGDRIYSKDSTGRVVVETILSNSSRYTDVLTAGDYKFSWCHLLPYRTRLSKPVRLSAWRDVLACKAVIFESDFAYTAKKRNIRFPRQQITMPHGGTKLIREAQTVDAELFAEFIGWYVSEGCFARKTNCIIVSQRKNKDFDRIVELCSIFGKPQIKRSMKNGSVFNISVFNKPLYDWIRRHCYKGGYGFQFKTVPRVIANNSPEVIDAFLEAFNRGDGYRHHGERYYCTSSINLGDDLIELIHKLGKKSGMYCKQIKGSTGIIEGRTITRTCDNYVVFECKNNKKGNHYGIVPSEVKQTIDKVQSITITGETYLFYTLVLGAKPIWTHNGGTTDRLRQISNEVHRTGQPPHQYQLAAYNFGSKEFMQEPDKFHDITSELYWNLRMLFQNHAISIPNDMQLRDELIARRWEILPNSKIKVESKLEYKKRTGGKSPDRSDSLALSFSGGNRNSYAPFAHDSRGAMERIQPSACPFTYGVNQRF